MSTSRRKGATGLEWLLNEASRPDPAQDAERDRPDPVEAALAGLVPSATDAAAAAGAPNAKSPAESWAVVPLQPIPDPAQEKPSAEPLPSRGSMESNTLDVVLGGASPAVSATPSAAPAPATVAPPPPAAQKPRAPEITGEHELPPPKNLRDTPRVAVEFEVRYRKGSEAVVGRGRNIGRDGMFVETKKFLPDGEVFTLQLAFGAPHNRRLSVIAEVAWSTGGNPDDPAREPAGMGLKFLDVDDNDLPFLASLAKR